MIYQEFLATLNEELAAFNPAEKLRYAVHEIMMRLKAEESIKFSEMSSILKEEFNIDIPTDLLKIIFERWDKYTDADYSIFKKSDKDWMDVWTYQNTVKRKLKDKQSFGKHRNKTTTTTTTHGGTNYTNRGGGGRNYSPTTWRDHKGSGHIYPGYEDFLD